MLKKPNLRPNLAYLCVYGCRAYAYIPQELHARKGKLAEQAHIGVLVGYDLTNIFAPGFSLKTQSLPLGILLMTSLYATTPIAHFLTTLFASMLWK